MAAYLFLVLLLVLAAALLARGAGAAEAFQEPPLLYTTMPLNFLGMVPGVRVEALPPQVGVVATLYAFLRNTGGLPLPLLGAAAGGTSGATGSLVLLDPQAAKEQVPGMPGPPPGLRVPEGFFVMVAPPTYGVQLALGGVNPTPPPCHYSWLGKRIGYFDVCEQNLIRAYRRGFRLPAGSLETVQLAPTEAGRLREALAENALDLVLMYIVPGSPLHRLVRSQEVAILGWSDLDIDRVFAYYPYVRKRPAPLRDLFMTREAGNRAIVREADINGNVLAMTLVARRLPGYLPASPGGFSGAEARREGFITRLDWPAEALDPAYKCYGDQSIGQMALCESRFDAQGLPKKYPNIWDARCFQNTDCPFWEARRGRGGCQPDGTCEMPVGVRREAYRRYTAEGIYAPFCRTDAAAEKDLAYLYPGDSLG